MKRFLVLVGSLGVIAASALGSRVNFAAFETNGVDLTGLDIWVDVIDNTSSIDLVFHNDSDTTDADVDTATLTEIWIEGTTFAQGALSNPQVVASSIGVAFSVDTTPGAPGNGIAPFGGAWAGSLTEFQADAPSAHNGVQPTEFLKVSFDFDNLNNTFGDLMSALEARSTRFSVHVQRLGSSNNKSAKLVTTAVHAPLPDAGGLAAAGLALACFTRRRTR
jgi:hypothetical protein